MIFSKPQYSRSKVNLAGEILLRNNPTEKDLDWAIDVINNWRSCHTYPINTFQATLREKIKNINKDALVAQRLKRMPSIAAKLKRFPKMMLSRMQDIGGLRAVVDTMHELRRLEQLYKDARFKHILVKEDDYIRYPQVTGYRSIHLIYRYNNEKAPEYNGLLIELQLRTRLQHAWATAVETVGTFIQHSLKSSKGPKEWLDFFALIGSAFAYKEKSPQVPGYEHLSEMNTYQEVRKMALKLKVQDSLQAYTVATDAISQDKAKGSYHLIILDPNEKKVRIQSFGRRRLDAASKAYLEIETEIISKSSDLQAVLVSTNSLKTLKRAYPSFYLDTHEFLTQLNKLIS